MSVRKTEENTNEINTRRICVACAVVSHSPTPVRALSLSLSRSLLCNLILIMPFALPFRLIRYKLKFDGANMFAAQQLWQVALLAALVLHCGLAQAKGK